MKKILLSSLNRYSLRDLGIFQLCHVQVRRQLSTVAPIDSKKPYYITTPIFYVNAGQHVKRYERRGLLNSLQLLMLAIYIP